jgi:hypothetical protein
MPTTRELIHYFETLTPEQTGRIGDIYQEDARFIDPFNDVRGSDAIAAIFTHMFVQLDSPRFEVREHFERPGQLMLLWTLHCRLRRHPLIVDGASHLRRAEDGRIILHRDYWDPASGIYEHLPGIGIVMRHLRRRLATQ